MARTPTTHRVVATVGLVVLFGAITAVAKAGFDEPPVVGVWQGPEKLADNTPHGLVTMAIEADSATDLRIFYHDDVVSNCNLGPSVSYFRAEWNAATKTIESLDRLKICVADGSVSEFNLIGPLYRYDTKTDSLSWVGGGEISNDMERLCTGSNATFVGGPGDDVYVGGSGSDVMEGRGGDDHLIGKGGFDVLCGGGGNDTLEGNRGVDLLWGDGGADVLMGGTRYDGLFGNGGGDTLNGGAERDLAHGGSGGDTISGGKGGDWLFGGTHGDLIKANNGTDRIWAGSGADHVFGNDGNDRMWGESGDDVLAGGKGTDRAFGGKGNDDCNAEITKGC